MQEKEILLRIGGNIKKYRVKKGYSQETFSHILGCGDKFVGHIERGERKPSLSKLIQIAYSLNIDILELFKK